jgi:hypothetical protein
MLRRAVVDYVLYKDHENLKMRRLGEEAAEWIWSDAEGGSSFDHICNSMNLPPELVRQRVEGMTVEYVRTLRGLGFDDG